MAFDAPTDVTVVSTGPLEGANEGSYVDWAAIIAGIVLASAISVLLLTFGSAVGLSFVNFGAGGDVSPIWIGIAAASWLLWVEVSSFMAGGYLAGRLRRRKHDATEHESDVRDGAHGLLVWAGGLIVGAILALSGIGAAVNTAGAAVSTLTNAASNVAGDAASNPALDYWMDTLFRPAADTPSPTTPVDTGAARTEVGRIFVQAVANGQFTEQDRAYISAVLQRTAGISDVEALNRIDAAFNTLQSAKQTALDTAEKARKTTVLGAFLTAAALLVSAVGAFWAAQMGGNHRDEGTEFADVFRRFR